jgi:hypothetical protein
VHGGFPAYPILVVTVSLIKYSRIFINFNINRYMHAILTNRGEAMHKIQNRLRDIMGIGRKAWNETPEIKKVSIPRCGVSGSESSD